MSPKNLDKLVASTVAVEGDLLGNLDRLLQRDLKVIHWPVSQRYVASTYPQGSHHGTWCSRVSALCIDLVLFT
jgi:uncharacterized protein YqjF (DUF2071 family)